MANGGNKPQRPLRPRQGTPGAKRKRRVVIDTPRPRPGDQRSRDGAGQTKAPREPQAPIERTGPVKVASGATVKDLSAALGVPASQIIKIMMGVGEMVTITQSLGDAAVELIAGRSRSSTPPRRSSSPRSTRTIQTISLRAPPS
jgi:LysM repeat protein